MARAPHYLRFVRTLALVSAALPIPLVTIVSGCSDDSTQSPAPGLRGAPGVGPAPGVMEGPPTGTRAADAAPDVADDVADAADANDGNDDGGGGPARGTPELPAAWLA